MEKEKLTKLADAAKFNLSEDEKNLLEEEINNILKYFNKLEEVDTEGIKPMYSPIDNIVKNRFGKDEVKKFENSKIFDKDKMLDNFYQVPDKEGN